MTLSTHPLEVYMQSLTCQMGLGDNAYFSSEGHFIPLEESKYVWIWDIFSGKGVASQCDQCNLPLSLSTKPLTRMLEILKTTMKHNFFPYILMMTGTVMALHYTTFIRTMKCCPITLGYGSSGTGKTTALHCGVALFGADDLRFYREATLATISHLCSTTNVPVGLDDLDSKGAFSKVIIDLYNGAKKGTVTRGESQPISTVVISSNFPPVEQQGYVNIKTLKMCGNCL